MMNHFRPRIRQVHVLENLNDSEFDISEPHQQKIFLEQEEVSVVEEKSVLS